MRIYYLKNTNKMKKEATDQEDILISQISHNGLVSKIYIYVYIYTHTHIYKIKKGQTIEQTLYQRYMIGK